MFENESMTLLSKKNDFQLLNHFRDCFIFKVTFNINDKTYNQRLIIQIILVNI